MRSVWMSWLMGIVAGADYFSNCYSDPDGDFLLLVALRVLT